MKTILFPFAFLLLLLWSCGRDEASQNDNKLVNPVDVYVAGKENNKACYWKNGILNLLTNGDGITPRKILVVNNTVYVFGASFQNGVTKYYFWKNNMKFDVDNYIGVPTNPSLTSLNPSHAIIDFEINNGDIYLLGEVRSAITIIGGVYTYSNDHCYWKNGMKTVLYTHNNGYPYAQLRNMAIYNNDVYIPIAKVINSVNVEYGFFKNNVYNVIPNISDFNNITSGGNGIYLSVVNNTTSPYTYSYKNLLNNVNSFSSINYKENLIIDGNDFYDFYKDGINDKYLKNDIVNQIIDTNGFTYIRDLKALNNNIYMIRAKFNQMGGLNTEQKVFINNIETMHTIETSNNVVTGNSYNCMFVVQN